MADKIVATWTNDSVGITSQKIYRTLNDGAETLLATLSTDVRHYVDSTFKDTDPYDASYRVTSVGTVGGVEVEETTETLVVHVRRNIDAMQIVTTLTNVAILSASQIAIEFEDGLLLESKPSPDVPGIYQIVHSFDTAADRNASLYNIEEGPIKGIYALQGLKKVLSWYSEGHIPYSSGGGLDLRALTFGSALTEVPPTAPPGVTDLGYLFSNCIAFNQDLSGWDVSAVTNMTNMFNQASIFNGDITNWNVSNVTNMTNMFGDAMAFNQDISNWNVGNVENMNQMFYNASAFNQDISGWRPTKAKNFARLFKGASAFNQNLNGWDVSAVTDFSECFMNASSFNQPLNSWDTSAATTMAYMFFGATTFNQDITLWFVGNVTDMTYMFNNATAFSQDLTQWCVALIEDASIGHTQFSNGSGLLPEQVPVWGTCPRNDRKYVTITGVRSTQRIAKDEDYQLDFQTDLESPTAVWSIVTGSDIATISPTGVLNVTEESANVVVQLVLNDDPFYTTTVSLSCFIRKDKFQFKFFSTGSSAVVFYAFPYTTVDWGDGSPVEQIAPGYTSISHTYPTDSEGVEYTVTVGDGLNPLDFRCSTVGMTTVLQWPGYGWTNMIIGTSSLVGVPSTLPSAPMSMIQMFAGAGNFNDPNISSWNMSTVTNTNSMFFGCHSFNQPLNDWDVSNVISMNGMFTSASSFNQPLGNWNVFNVGDMASMFNNATVFNQDLTQWCVTKITGYTYNFDIGSAMSPSNRPVWGTCPRGEGG